MGQMWSWQRKADGIAMAVDVKVGVGRLLLVLQKTHHQQRAEVLQNTCWFEVSVATDLSRAALLIFPCL